MTKKSKPAKKAERALDEKNRAKYQRVFDQLHIGSDFPNHKFIVRYVRSKFSYGCSVNTVTRQLKASHLYKSSLEVENGKRVNTAIISAHQALRINDSFPIYDQVQALITELAMQNLSGVEIATKLDAHPKVIESRRLQYQRVLERERKINEDIEERKKTRVNMADVIAYLAEKERKKFAATLPAESVSSVPRRQAPRRLTHAGAITIKHENPRVYDIPNMRAADKILSERSKAQKAQRRQNKSAPVKAPVVELVPEVVLEVLPEALPEEASMVPVVELVPAVELVPEVVAEPETMQEPQPAPQPELIDDEPEQVYQKPAAPVIALPTKPKREGSEVTVISRPDQPEFAAAVRANCFDRCVITGAALRERTEAAHLTEHKAGGADHYTNGLLLRIDLHRLFDAGVIAICPETLTVHVEPDALADDPDLQQYHGKPIAELRRPIDPANLAERWRHFQRRLRMIELAREFS